MNDKVEGVGEPVTLHMLDLLGPPESWKYVGVLVLRKLASMHPDAFAPFASFAPLLSGDA